MARTKQTARKCMAQVVPRRQLVAQRVARLSGPIVGASIPPVEEELDNFVNTQQFSLRFDDQDKCEKEAV